MIVTAKLREKKRIYWHQAVLGSRYARCTRCFCFEIRRGGDQKWSFKSGRHVIKIEFRKNILTDFYEIFCLALS